MNNEERIKKVFAESLEMDIKNITDDLKYNSFEWDSIAHMALIAALEDEFDIMIDTDDIIDMSSFKKAKELLKKYNI